MNELEKHLDAYLQYCRFGKALDAKTLKAYRIDLNQFTAYLSADALELNRDSIAAYITLLHQHYKVKTVKRKIASIKAFLNYLVFENILDANPVNAMRIKLHEPSLLPRTIPTDAIAAILQSAYRQKNAAPGSRSAILDAAVLEMLFATGMRVSELCNLKEENVDLEEGSVKIFGKGARERMIQIGNSQVLAVLQEYHRVCQTQIGQTGWFFLNRLGNRLSDQSVRRIILRHANAAALSQHITPHMFRHSFATMLLDEGVDIRYIQQFLGHSSIVTTQIYTHVASRKQRDILMTRHPRNKMHLNISGNDL